MHTFYYYNPATRTKPAREDEYSDCPTHSLEPIRPFLGAAAKQTQSDVPHGKICYHFVQFLLILSMEINANSVEIVLITQLYIRRPFLTNIPLHIRSRWRVTGVGALVKHTTCVLYDN